MANRVKRVSDPHCGKVWVLVPPLLGFSVQTVLKIQVMVSSVMLDNYMPIYTASYTVKQEFSSAPLRGPKVAGSVFAFYTPSGPWLLISWQRCFMERRCRLLRWYSVHGKSVAYPEGVSGVQPPRNSEGPPKNRAKLNPIVKTVLKNAEFRTSTHQDVRKKRQ